MNAVAMYLDENPYLSGTPDEHRSRRLAPADQAPTWRQYAQKPQTGLVPRVARNMDDGQAAKGRSYRGKAPEANLVNAALFLRRPLLITGNAGVGKSTLAYAVAFQLGLGNVLRWGVTSRSTLKDALYHYDAIARFHENPVQPEAGQQTPQGSKTSSKLEDIGKFIKLGPLGTALLPTRAAGYFPRVLLVDEIDKSDADLPSDLLHVLEEGSFEIAEISRLTNQLEETITLKTSDRWMPEAEINRDGWVRCDDFPFIVMTSNGERDFPPAFLRRCLRLDVKRNNDDLERIVDAHLKKAAEIAAVKTLIDEFCQRVDQKKAVLATDQLLNAIHLLRSGFEPLDEALKEALFRSLNEAPTGGTEP